MSYQRGWQPGGTRQPGFAVAAAGDRLRLVQKVYGLLLASILVAVGAGGLVLATPATAVPTEAGMVMVPSGVMAVDSASFVIWLALLAMLLFGRKLAYVPGLNLVFLFAFTGICGAWVSPRVWLYGVGLGQPQVVGMAGALTALIFVTLSGTAFVMKRDFNFLGAGLGVASIGLIGACLLNVVFFHSSWASTMIAWAVLAFASGCILFNTSQMLRRMEEQHVVAMTISLFVDLLNLFLALLRILGGGRR